MLPVWILAQLLLNTPARPGFMFGWILEHTLPGALQSGGSNILALSDPVVQFGQWPETKRMKKEILTELGKVTPIRNTKIQEPGAGWA